MQNPVFRGLTYSLISAAGGQTRLRGQARGLGNVDSYLGRGHKNSEDRDSNPDTRLKLAVQNDNTKYLPSDDYD